MYIYHQPLTYFPIMFYLILYIYTFLNICKDIYEILVQNMLLYEDLVNNEMSARTYLNKFSAPERSISSLLISMFSFDRFD